MEFWQDIFDAIQVVTAQGIIVCEAAGNGGVFPTARVVRSVDGRDLMLSHGGPMPLFYRRPEVLEGARQLNGLYAVRGLAHHLKPVVMVGQAGLTDGVLNEVGIALDEAVDPDEVANWPRHRRLFNNTIAMLGPVL